MASSDIPNVEDLSEKLKVICSREYLQSSLQPREHRYTNHEIAQVSELLGALNQRLWMAVPRLYIVLSHAGLLKLRDLFFSMQHTDAHFPYSIFTLPKGIGPDDRSSFLRVQVCVLAGTNHVSQWDLGEHVRFASPEQVPFERQAILGSGGSGQVEVVVVRSQTNMTHVAFRTRLVRKIIKRMVFGRFQQGLETFKNELKVLKQVQHRHLVEIIGSYTDPTYAALIMSPVADCDLSDFLRLAIGDNQKLGSMRTFFGCLAASLAYLHGKKIRHKDMKPSNILVQGSNVLITDFGLSKDCNNTRSTTEGPTGRTPKYCSPEVADNAPRNYSSDIWSLGCVFLEMLTVLKGCGIDQLAAFMRENGTEIPSYHANMAAVTMWLEKLRLTYVNDSDNDLIPWIQVLLQHDRDLRPSAETLSSEIAQAHSVSGRIGEFCGICCRGETEEFVDIEMEDDPLFVPESPLFEPEGEDMKIARSIEESPHPLVSLDLGSFRHQPPTTRVTTAMITPADTEIEMDRSALMTPHSESDAPTARTVRDLPRPRFFILRSNSAMDIETSCAFGAWTCSKRTNQRLAKAFRETQAPVYLIFSVVESRKFCGVARMTSPINWDRTLPHWVSLEWNGNFDIEWKSYLEIGYDEVGHLRMNEGNEGNFITRVMSGMEICRSSGEEMMRRFQVSGF